MTRQPRFVCLLVGVWLAGCKEDDAEVDPSRDAATSADATVAADASRADANVPRDGGTSESDGGRDASVDIDGGNSANDAGSIDAGLPDASGSRDAATPLNDSAASDAGSASDAAARCAGDGGGITLPNGFCATIFASDVVGARHLTVTPAGDVYVAIEPPESPDGGAQVSFVGLRDSDGDGYAEQRTTTGGGGGNGIAWQSGQLYFASESQVVRYAAPNGTLQISGQPDTIVSGLPADGDHKAKSIVLAGDSLYVNIGSASNACQEQNRTLRSPGVDPCPELSERAGVWRFDADTLNQQQGDGERFVAGARNLNALATTSDGSLYAAKNGRDQLYENWPDLYTEAQDSVLPSEEVLRLTQSADYGWPYCYYDPTREKYVLAPEYGGDGGVVGRCASATPPIGVLPAHWAPLGMVFYEGTAFPARYRGGAFIANHGSRFAPNATGPLPGYNVVFIPFENGLPSAAYERFAEGFAGDARPLPDSAKHRPVGVAVSADGALFISDDQGGVVWRVVYVGG